MLFIIISLTYLTILTLVSSECAYFNSYYYLVPLEVCLQASGQDFNSHWQRCDSGNIIEEKFSTTDCTGSVKYSQAYDSAGSQCTGSGYDCNYIIIRNSGSGSACPNSETSPYIDYAYIINQCFESDLYSTKQTFSCSSGVLNFGTCYNCQDGTCQVNNKIKINGQCNNYNQWLSLPYGCGTYENHETGFNGGETVTTIPITTTTTEPPLECKGAIVMGISHYLPWITSYTIESDAVAYSYQPQPPANYYLMYPCQVIGNYALPFELYVKLRNCWDRPQHNYACLDSVVLTLVPRSTRPIIIEMNGLKTGITTLLTIKDVNNYKYVYNDLPLLNQKFSEDGISGSYDIEIVSSDDSDNDNEYFKNQISVYIDGSECEPALRFSIMEMYLFVDCPTCYTDNICGVLGHWNEIKGNITYPIKNKHSSNSIDINNENDLQLFFESWEHEVDKDSIIRRRLQTDYPLICDNYEYKNMFTDINGKCDAELYGIYTHKDCCDDIPSVCNELKPICKYDICACIQSLNNTNQTYSSVNYTHIIDICFNITQFSNSLDAICEELRYTFDVSDFYGEYNTFTGKVGAFFLLILIVPIVVGIYLLINKKQSDEINESEENDLKGRKDDINVNAENDENDNNDNLNDNNNNYTIIKQIDNDDNNYDNMYEGEIR